MSPSDTKKSVGRRVIDLIIMRNCLVKITIRNFIIFISILNRHEGRSNRVGVLWYSLQKNYVKQVPRTSCYLMFIPVSQVLQLTFEPFHPVLSDQEQFPFLYQMGPRDISLALAMVSLMLHFNWNWVGLAISHVDQGIHFL